MPRVHNKKKSVRGKEYKCSRCGRVIQPGEHYFQWSFRYGGTRFACAEHRPRPSELTQSLMSEVYAAQEDAQEAMAKTESIEDIMDLVEQVASAAEEVAGQYREAAEPFGGAGENAERADELESWVYELQSFQPDEDDDEALDNARTEADELIGGCPL